MGTGWVGVGDGEVGAVGVSFSCGGLWPLTVLWQRVLSPGMAVTDAPDVPLCSAHSRLRPQRTLCPGALFLGRVGGTPHNLPWLECRHGHRPVCPPCRQVIALQRAAGARAVLSSETRGWRPSAPLPSNPHAGLVTPPPPPPSHPSPPCPCLAAAPASARVCQQWGHPLGEPHETRPAPGVATAPRAPRGTRAPPAHAACAPPPRRAPIFFPRRRRPRRACARRWSRRGGWGGFRRPVRRPPSTGIPNGSGRWGPRPGRIHSGWGWRPAAAPYTHHFSMRQPRHTLTALQAGAPTRSVRFPPHPTAVAA